MINAAWPRSILGEQKECFPSIILKIPKTKPIEAKFQFLIWSQPTRTPNKKQPTMRLQPGILRPTIQNKEKQRTFIEVKDNVGNNSSIQLQSKALKLSNYIFILSNRKQWKEEFLYSFLFLSILESINSSFICLICIIYVCIAYCKINILLIIIIWLYFLACGNRLVLLLVAFIPLCLSLCLFLISLLSLVSPHLLFSFSPSPFSCYFAISHF